MRLKKADPASVLWTPVGEIVRHAFPPIWRLTRLRVGKFPFYCGSFESAAWRAALRPLADASVLVLLIVAVAVHFAMSGLALVFFGPEGVRTEPMTRALFDLGPVLVSGQSILIVAARSRARRCARPPSIVQQVELKTERVASATPARTLR
jgi:hypothetical protein